jgi:wyosine [tRNA(Phe)-imidazoG37] synthetase (radical SAM superfamily)
MPEKNKIYGPVPSRRLGMSLGIDLAEFKHCPLDCIYCQLKTTTRLDCVRESPVTVDAIVSQAARKLKTVPDPDFLTLGGSGEPTLYADLGELITKLKDETGLPVAILTNGVLFQDDQVRADAALADVVLPSLDAWDEDSYKRINRPGEGLTFQALMDGMIEFRKEFTGEIWLEVMILRGISDDETVAKKLAGLAAMIKPDRIQLNTPVRPTATELAAPVSREKLESLAGLFTPLAEVAADFPEVEQSTARSVTEDEVMEMLRRRPCTVDDVTAGLRVQKMEVVKIVEKLMSKHLITPVEQESRTYYKTVD